MAKKPPTAAEKQFHAYVRGLPCLVCGASATLHHVTGYSDRMGRLPRREDRCAPLCPMHHQAVFDPYANDPVSVERLNHRGFFEKHGIDLMAEAERIWNQYHA